MKPRSKRNQVKKEVENSTTVREAGQSSTRKQKSVKVEEKELEEESMVQSESSDQENESESESEESSKSEEIKPKSAKKKTKKGENSNSRVNKCEKEESSKLAGKTKIKDEETESEESSESEEERKPKALNKKSKKGEKSNSRNNKCEKGESSNSSSDDNNSKEKSDDETDNEEEEFEDDVKVCDICGDVGEEDKLATCIKCTDGAEHTYCMKVFMKKLPEGEWLCEECEIEAEKEKLLQKKGKQKAVNKTTEKQNTEDSVYVLDQEDEFLAIELLKKESKSKAPRTLNSYSKKRDQDESQKNLESEITDLESGVLKKPETEIQKKVESEILKKPESEVSKKMESEIPKKVEFGELKKKGTLNIRENLNNSDLEKGKLNTSISKPPLPIQPPRGNFSKSSSFKSSFSKEPKVKQISEVPQNQKITKEPSVSSINNNVRKEGPDQKVATKSSSFKKPPMKPSSKLSDVKDPRDNNNLNNNNKGGSILGRPSSTGLLSTPKLDSSTQNPDNLGRNESKKPSLIPKKDEKAPSISTCPLLDSILNRNIPSVQSRAPRCQRCNETGHSIGSCPKNPNKGTDRITNNNNIYNGSNSSNSVKRINKGELRSNVIPQLEFIWQGGFELVKEGMPSNIFDGFQAHFSTSTCPKLRNLLKNGLPCKMSLQELPRHQMWPAQFSQNGPTESHIALYFFPKDQESYENCYVKLVESMRKNDVALRGRIDSIELLVFPSTLLPEYSQRWNRLFYLWGVFKGKSANLSKFEKNFNGKSVNLSKDEANEIRVLDVSKAGSHDETLTETRLNRKRSNSAEPVSNPELFDINGEKEHKKAKIDLNGDFHLDDRIEETTSSSNKTEKEEKLQTTVIQNTGLSNTGFDLEKPPPDFELALEDVEKLPYNENNKNIKGENNDCNKINDDESASSLSLSLALSDDSNRGKSEKNVVL